MFRDGFGGEVVPVIEFGVDFALDEFAEDVTMEKEGIFALAIS